MAAPPFPLMQGKIAPFATSHTARDRPHGPGRGRDTPIPHLPCTMHSLRTLLLAFVLLPSALAQSLVQVRVSGRLVEAARIEVEVGAQVGVQARRLDVHVLLSRGTSGGDLLALVAGRLAASGFQAYLGPESQDGSRSLFVERALFLNLHVAAGMQGQVVACEGVPRGIRVTGGEQPSTLVVEAQYRRAVTGQYGRAEIHFELEQGMHPARSAEGLLKAASEAKWAGARPSPEVWSPVHLADGSRFTALALTFKDARVELDLSPKDD